MKKIYSIGDISKLLGLTPESLRHYERLGLIKPTSIGENGYRFYDMQTYTHLYFIKKYRSLGFSLPEIKEIFDKDTDEQKIARFGTQRSKLLEQLRELQQQMDDLDLFATEIKSAKEQIDTFDMVKTEAMWFIPIRNEESLCVPSSKDRNKKNIFDKVSGLNYTLIADLTFKEDHLAEVSRRAGFSMLAGSEKPAESAEYISGTTALRTTIKMFDGEPIAQALTRTQVIARLAEIGIDMNRRIFGHMINLSKDGESSYAIFTIYIPIIVVSE